jgi:hypothetical protein
MSEPPIDRDGGRPSQDWWTRPRIVLPVVGALVVLVALLTPQQSVGRSGDPRLSSYLAGPMGARALYETAARFGFAVSRRDLTPDPGSITGTTIHAVLAPPMELTAGEAHAYLEAVRGGDALLYVYDGRTPLADSLGLSSTASGGILQVAEHDTAGCRGRNDLIPSLWLDGHVHLLGVRPRASAARHRSEFAPLVSGLAQPDAVVAYAALGFSLGHGRVIAVADPDLLRNDVIRRCRWGTDAIAMQMLEWLRAGGPVPRTAIAFDEYHQGFAHSPSLIALVGGFLVGHPVGRAILLLVVAGLVLLLAAAPRALSPRDRETIERRDPLEQVDALAQAYEQVRASRTATARLLRGVRSRLGEPTSRHLSDNDFLAAAQAAVPERAGDVALISRALRERVAPRDLPEVGAALRRLEDSLTTTNA